MPLLCEFSRGEICRLHCEPMPPPSFIENLSQFHKVFAAYLTSFTDTRQPYRRRTHVLRALRLKDGSSRRRFNDEACRFDNLGSTNQAESQHAMSLLSPATIQTELIDKPCHVGHPTSGVDLLAVLPMRHHQMHSKSVLAARRNVDADVRAR